MIAKCVPRAMAFVSVLQGFSHFVTVPPPLCMQSQITAGEPSHVSLKGLATGSKKLVTAVQGGAAAVHRLAAGCQRLVAGPMVTAEECPPAAQDLWQLLESLQQLPGRCSQVCSSRE